MSKFGEFYWTWFWQALTMQFAQAFLMGKQFSTDFLATVGPIFMQLFYYAHSLFWSFLAYYGQKMLRFFKRKFVCLRENLAGIDQHHQGHIWTKNSRWLTPITSYSYTQIKKIYLENPDKIFLSGFLREIFLKVSKTQIKIFYLENPDKIFLSDPDKKFLSGFIYS